MEFFVTKNTKASATYIYNYEMPAIVTFTKDTRKLSEDWESQRKRVLITFLIAINKNRLVLVDPAFHY